MYRFLRLLDELPPCMQVLFDLLRLHGPAVARGYRLIWHRDDGSTVPFPSGNRSEWRDSAGRLSWRRSFRLWPFEIPRVDFPGTYGVCFVGPRDAQLPTPEPLLDGVVVEPSSQQGEP
jgi:hypothetical protein